MPVAWDAILDRSRASVIAYARMTPTQTAKRSTSGRKQRAHGAREGSKAGEPAVADSLADSLAPVVIGARVKALRESAALSLRDLSERSGVSAPMLSQVERGETSPTLTVAARIAAGLELRLSQLLRLDEGGAVSVVHASQRQRGGNKRRGHGFEVLTSVAARTARRALAPHARTRRRDRRH